ncbi:sensor domain-containing diguanylate cyclase [Mycobacterium sp. shizuoka-1]|uniref:sensor domain-containing diguanylate cyclase n=1 Tax=Mycobacterium sp. shizuoka-1 TaxID=2039281 RepID=UPI001E33EBE4|nr:sensor domain-containing diguanylate cyclase [Mycobacterium sp. shizuoka-1]
MAKAEPDADLEALVTRSGPAALAMVLVLSTSNWIGWATGNELLTRIFRSWPQMTPWAALLLATLAGSILVQSGTPTRTRMWIGRGLAAAAALVALTILAEYVINRPLGIDRLWFPEGVSTLQRTWPGRPSPQTASTVLLVAIAAGLTRLDRWWARVVRTESLVVALAIPFIVVTTYASQSLSVSQVPPSTGMGIATAVGLLLLIAAAFAARPDWNPVAWLLARPDGRALIRMFGLLAALPIVVGMARLAFLALGVREDAVWALSISVSALVIGVLVFYLSQREQRLLIDRAVLVREREDAETRYRILAENAVDAVVHLRGMQIVWISPSVHTTFGKRPEAWIGSDFRSHLHADDAELVRIGDERSDAGEPAVERFRICRTDGGYHWVDCRSKPYVDGDGGSDGVIAALRVVDDQVEFERRLERLARFDTLTGLVNRAEALHRLESALAGRGAADSHIGVLFCDIDGFKGINDSYGHAVGDSVLTAVAQRIQACVRADDTVGRTGGDEILVVLPGVRSLDEVSTIAEDIRRRAAEPVDYPGGIINATLSIGATLAVPGESATTATARADAAMYRAKQTGRNSVVQI